MIRNDIKLRSRYLATQEQVLILLPDRLIGDSFSSAKHGCEPQKSGKLRVLWLLHGAMENYDTFLVSAGIEQTMQAYKDVMVVIPNALNSDYANHAEFANGYLFTDFFFRELMPFIYRTFPASDKREDNVIAGYSMGGAGALMLGLHRPELFCGIGALGASVRPNDFLKPFLHMTGQEFRQYAMEHRKELPTEFGDPEEGIKIKEINMICKYPTVRDYCNSMECTSLRFPEALAAGNIPEIFLCAGDNDGCYQPVTEFYSEAVRLGMENISYETIPGLDHMQAQPEAVRKMAEHYFHKT